MKKQSGFTLTELLIVIAIVGILAGIGYPKYTQYVLKSKRSEAQAALLDLANKQELYYLDHREYADDLTELGKNADPFITESGYYAITTSSAKTTVGFSLQATAIASQAADEDCASLSITQELVKSALDNADSAASDCWK